MPLAHIDLYRLTTVSDAVAIGIEEYLSGAGVTVVEWAERIESLLPAQTRRIHLTVLDETTRQIEMT